jgi:DNA repair protein SbcC/Rad50
MIPQKLTIKNFLSYQQVTLDFAGLHTACICGVNGAGKSSLLEAMTWAIWGQSRAESEDDIIHMGMKEAQVDFVFRSGTELYRIIRTRPKGSASSLEFQINTEGKFRSLTERGLRATQQVILSHLKMDYDTFVNSAYLRQGRADEFMLKRPSDRKQVLAEILNLSQYDDLSDRAKDITRTCKGEVMALEHVLTNLRQQISDGEAIALQLEALRTNLAQEQQQDGRLQTQLKSLEQQQQQRQNLQQQLSWQRKERSQLQVEIDRLTQQAQQQHQQVQSLSSLLAQSDRIQQDYAHYQQLTTQETVQNQKLQQYQSLTQQHTALSQQLATRQSELKGQLRHDRAQLESLQQQQQELQGILIKAPDVEAAQVQLQVAREQLKAIESLQSQSAPLLQRRQELQRQVDREAAKLSARLEELQRSRQQLQAKYQAQVKLVENAQGLEQQIVALQKKEVYRQRVHEKGLERRDFLERLKERAIDCAEKLDQIHHKLGTLSVPNAPCPLCDRPLDRAHWALVQQKHNREHEELQAELWLIKEQQSASDCEIKVLREEYRHLSVELSQLQPLLEQKGNLQAQLEASQSAQAQITQIEIEIVEIAERLEKQDFCPEAQDELILIDRHLTQLNYDEKNHALAKGEVERWRWADIKLAELRSARQKSENLSQRLPELEQKCQKIEARLAANAIDLELQQQLEQCDRSLHQISYDPAIHQQIRAHKEKAQPALLRHQELTLATKQHPIAAQQYQQTQQILSDRTVSLQAIDTNITNLDRQILAIAPQLSEPDLAAKIQNLQAQLQQRRSHLDALIGQIGQLEQATQQLQKATEQEKATVSQLEQVRHRQYIHQELAQAFGKNGIQALMIETVLPQIEAEANQILGQLTNHQFHVRFITQKAGKKSDKVIDTLEIEIADRQGTRPYETYSGGEAFRINFAIRLALSRILAQRKGGTLQTLIIDEGFGSQDPEGCDRLIAAINAIAPNFECILAITHMPPLKEAFSAQIEVTKTDAGSKLTLQGI